MAESANLDVQELDGCVLGTQKYWEATYDEEIRNFKTHGDVGEVWFGEESALRIIRWMCKSALVSKTDRIIDLGCGNGMLLIELARAGFINLIGVDYSTIAVDLACAINETQNLDIKYQVFDILDSGAIEALGEFSIAHDKGTYDAISLNPEDPKSKRLKYIDNVARMLKPMGLLILTSCNWTENELITSFKDTFKLVCVIPTPQFKFGGAVGNVVTSIVLQKII